MKLQKMANIALKAMVKSYSESGKECFYFDYFRALFPNESDDSISNSIYLLRDDGFVTVLSGSGIAYMTFISATGIRACQENTMLKKGYSLIKEIKSLIH